MIATTVILDAVEQIGVAVSGLKLCRRLVHSRSRAAKRELANSESVRRYLQHN